MSKIKIFKSFLMGTLSGRTWLLYQQNSLETVFVLIKWEGTAITIVNLVVGSIGFFFILNGVSASLHACLLFINNTEYFWRLQDGKAEIRNWQWSWHTYHVSFQAGFDRVTRQHIELRRHRGRSRQCQRRSQVRRNQQQHTSVTAAGQ